MEPNTQTGRRGFTSARGSTRGFTSARGFTMVELVIVMSIIVILVSIGVPIYTKSILRAREAVLHDQLSAALSKNPNVDYKVYMAWIDDADAALAAGKPLPPCCCATCAAPKKVRWLAVEPNRSTSCFDGVAPANEPIKMQ